MPGLPLPTLSSHVSAHKSSDAWIGILMGTCVGALIGFLPRPELVILPLAGILGFFFFSLNLHLGLGLLVFVSYLRLSDTLVHFHNIPSIASPLILYFLMLTVFRWIGAKDKPQGLMLPVSLMLGYLGACLTSLLSARAPEVTLLAIGELLKDLIFAITLMLMYQIDPKNSLKTSLWALMLAGLLMGGIATYQYLSQSFTSDFGGFGQAAKQHLTGMVQSFRISGTIGDPNFFAQILLVVVPLALDRMIHERRWSLRGLASLVFFTTSSSILFTYSRGALVGLFWMLMLTLRQHRPPKGIIIAAVTFSLISLGFLPEHYLDRLTALYDAAGSSSGPVVEDSLQGRISELYSGLLMFIDHPLFGVGLGNYPVDYQDYAQKLGIESRHSERHAHNMFLEWIAETGLFGGLILFALIKEMFKRLKLRHVDLLRQGDTDSARMLDAFRLGLWGYFIASLFLHAAFPRYFWLFSALAMAIPGSLIVAKFPLRLKASEFRQPQSKP